MKVLILLSYDGTEYHGFQVQKNALTVCEVLQNALEQLYGERPPVKGCSRTDAGVHARQYGVSFVQPKPISPERLPLALNQWLPADIRVHRAQQMPDDFHARYCAQSKEYLYRVRMGEIDSPFDMRYTWRVAQNLNVPAMQKAAQIVVGTHDFRAFMSTKGTVENTVRTVFFFTVQQQEDIINFHICADGYLYNMVRILVGTLVAVGKGKMPPQQVEYALQSRCRTQAGETAPAHGLFLYQVNYPKV